MNYRKLKKIFGIASHDRPTLSAIFGNRNPKDSSVVDRLGVCGLKRLQMEAAHLLRNSVSDASGQFVRQVERRMLKDESLAEIARAFEFDKLVNTETSAAFGADEDFLADIVISLVGYVESVGGAEKCREFVGRILRQSLANMLRRYTKAAEVRIEPPVTPRKRLAELLEEIGKPPPKYILDRSKNGMYVCVAVESSSSLVIGKGRAPEPESAHDRAAGRAVRYVPSAEFQLNLVRLEALKSAA